ncbi:MAG TPA: hypothetical protein PK264_22040 [Hyphomicrobiaceae bacterium]|nr:hypothetical protein [Hyphomicrobiaceae bacterium]
MIIHLNGWPGAGKRTIGEALARRLGARFVHNHLLHDVARVSVGQGGRDNDAYWSTYERVRSAAYDALALRPRCETFVMTNALVKDDPRETEAWGHVVALAMRRDVPLVPVVLDIALEENCRRVASPDRVGRKLSDPTLIREFRRTLAIQHPDVAELIVLDVTGLSPEMAALTIEEGIAAVRPALKTATLDHLRIR